MNARSAIWIIFGVAFTALVGFLYFGIEWTERTLDIGYGDEARRNNFLAAELFLQAHEIETETVSGMTLLDELPSTEDLILLSASRKYMSERRRSGLREWVENGGLLMIVPRSLYDPETGGSEDPLLDSLGVFLLDGDAEEEESEEDQLESEAHEEDKSDEDGETTGQEPAAEPASTDSTTADADVTPDRDALDEDKIPSTIGEIFELMAEPPVCDSIDSVEEVSTQGSGPVQLELSSIHELAVYDEMLDDAFFSENAQVLSIDIGEGRVVAMTSFHPFTNRRIHCHDHAFFLHYITTNTNKVWLLHDPEIPSLAGLLWLNLPATTAGLSMLIFLLLAAASLRFGTPPESGESARRELREHLEASVTFYFRRGGFASLMARLRADLVRRGPDPDHPEQLADWAERAELSVDDAREALTESPPRQRRKLLKRVQTLLRLRRTK